MTRKLLLVIGLAILGGCLVAGTAGAGSGSIVGTGENGVTVNLPDGQDLDQVQVLPQCSNLADDDGDGVKDLADPDCTGPLDATESGTSGVPTPPSPTTTTPTTPTTTTPAPTGDGGQGTDDGGSRAIRPPAR